MAKYMCSCTPGYTGTNCETGANVNEQNLIPHKYRMGRSRVPSRTLARCFSDSGLLSLYRSKIQSFNAKYGLHLVQLGWLSFDPTSSALLFSFICSSNITLQYLLFSILRFFLDWLFIICWVMEIVLDVDECAEGIAVCQNGGTCHNTVGSWHCTCVPGYTGSKCSTGK